MKNMLFIAAALLMLCLSGCQAASDEDDMVITCFDVGQADSFLIQCGGKTMLMDAGTASDGAEVAEELEDMEIGHIDYLMITHFDKDHVGGAAQIIRKFDIGTVLRPVYMKESKQVTAYIQELEKKAGVVEEIILRDTYRLDLGSASMVIHPAAQELYEKDPSNNSSLVTEIFHGSSSLLFTGDVEKERIKELLDEELAWGYDFLKVPHHGKHEKILGEFFEKVGAESAVITCSNKNPEEAETLTLLEAVGTEYCLTRNGSVRIVSDGEQLSVEQ